MKKQIIVPMMLIASLSACDTNQTVANNPSISQEEETPTENPKKKIIEVSKENNNTKDQDNTDSESEESKEDVLENEPPVEEERAENKDDNKSSGSEETQTENTKPSRKDQIAEIKAKADEKYSRISAEKPILSIDDKEVSLDFSSFKIDDFTSKLGLSYVGEIENEDAYIPVRTYKTLDDKEIDITAEDLDDNFYIEKLENVDISLPYGITSSDSIEEAKEKLGDLAFQFGNPVYEDDSSKEYLDFASKDIIYHLTYKDEVLTSALISQSNEVVIKNYLMSDLANNLPIDHSGKVTIEGKEIEFPITVDDLAQILGGDIEPANEENVLQFLNGPDKEADLANYYYYNKVVLATEKGNYLVEFYEGGDHYQFDPIEVNTVLSISFNPTDKSFSFTNENLEIDQENITDAKKILDESDVYYNDDYITYFYLDDRYIVNLSDEEVSIVYLVSAHNRYIDELGLIIGN